MLFDMTILPSEFKENRLKVISPVKLLVEVVDGAGKVVESFETNSDQTTYDITTDLSDDLVVNVKLLPDQVAAFYPVVQAL